MNAIAAKTRAKKRKSDAPPRPPGCNKKARWNSKRGCWTQGKYWFDESTADRAVQFFPTYLTFTKGEWAGKKFILEPWEADDIVRPLFGWKRADGTRRYRRCYVWVARKNGKSELAAGIAIMMLVFDNEAGGEVYSIASNEVQAKIVFDRAAHMVSKSKWLLRDLIAYKKSIYCPALYAAFQPLSGRAKGKHGLSASGLIGDEIHEWLNGDLYKYVHDSSVSRRQPLEFLISTAGKKGDYGETIWEECLKIRDGLINIPDTLVVIYAAEIDDDWLDETVWAKANPNLGKSKKIEAMREAAHEARELPRLLNDFLCYQLNLWAEQAVRWLPMDAIHTDGRRYGWKYCSGPISWRELESHLAGKFCYSGIDLSSVVDLASLIHYFPVQDGVDVPTVLCRFYKPAVYLEVHGKRDKLPYKRWASEGALTATPGDVIDYDWIEKDTNEDAEKFDIQAIGIDRHNATQTTINMQKAGLPIEFFGQGFISMNPPAKMLEKLVISNGIHHGSHPILYRHARVVAVETDAADNIKPTKKLSTERIDGIIGLVEAIGMAEMEDGKNKKLTSKRIIERGGFA